MLFRVQWMFQAQAAGWSESLYRDGADYEAALDAGMQYAYKRLALCGKGVRITSVRVSKTGVNGDARAKQAQLTTSPADVLANPNYQYVPPAYENANVVDPWTGMNCRLVADGVERGRIYMRGLPDDLFDGVTGFVPNQAWINAFIEYVNLVKGGYSIRGYPRATVLDRKPIDDLIPATGAADTAVVKAFGLGAIEGQHVYIGKARTDKGTFSGRFVLGDGDNVLGFRLLGTNGQFFVYKKQTGYIRIMSPQVYAISDVRYGQAVSRRVGRPFGQQRGRRSKRGTSSKPLRAGR